MPQADALRTARERRFAEWFEHRHWRVCTEMTGTREVDGATIHYDKGHFRIDPPHTFQTPLGHRGRAGVLIQETDEQGNDLLKEGGRQTFGEITLWHAAEQYGTVTGLT